MNKEKFIINKVDEDRKQFIPVDSIGIITTGSIVSRDNGKKQFGIMLINKFSDRDIVMNFMTEIERDEKLKEILEKVSKR